MVFANPEEENATRYISETEMGEIKRQTDGRSMDDTMLRNLETRLNYLRNLQARKEEVCKSIATQEKLTADFLCLQCLKSNVSSLYFPAVLPVCFFRRETVLSPAEKRE